MKTIYSLVLAGSVAFAVSCQSGQKKPAEKSASEATSANVATTELNKLSAEETSGGWKLLFDGTTSTGWRGYNKTEFPATAGLFSTKFVQFSSGNICRSCLRC